jgi:hypothetical protein
MRCEFPNCYKQATVEMVTEAVRESDGHTYKISAVVCDEHMIKTSDAGWKIFRTISA